MYMVCFRSWNCIQGLPRSTCNTSTSSNMVRFVLFNVIHCWIGQPSKFNILNKGNFNVKSNESINRQLLSPKARYRNLLGA